MLSPLTLDGGAKAADGAAPPRKSELDMQTFLALLTVQLEHQNPLEPMNDRDFFAQMAQLGQVQGLEKLQGSMEMSQASSLLGKKVTALQTEGAGAGTLVHGLVQRVSVRNGDRILTLKTDAGGLVDVSLAGVQEVTA